jgi:hypothetical protein
MMYKLFIEDGLYQDIDTKEPRNLMEVEIAYTPEGINVGWDEFDSVEEAMTHYNIELKPIEDDTDTEGNI